MRSTGWRKMGGNGLPIQPIHEKANTQGFRHLAFRVSDIEKTVALLKQKGIDPVSAIQEYFKAKKKLGYFRGREGILHELAHYAETPGIQGSGPSQTDCRW